jgi:hypothetical protein
VKSPRSLFPAASRAGRASLLVVGALLLSLGGLAACGGGDSSTGGQLAIEDFQFTRLENGTRLFTGKVYNPTSESVREAQINVSLLDVENRRVGTAMVRVPDIASQDTTTFRQVFDSDQEVSGARVKSLTVM